MDLKDEMGPAYKDPREKQATLDFRERWAPKEQKDNPALWELMVLRVKEEKEDLKVRTFPLSSNDRFCNATDHLITLTLCSLQSVPTSYEWND